MILRSTMTLPQVRDSLSWSTYIDDAIAAVSLTGSVEAGRQVAMQAAGVLKKPERKPAARPRPAAADAPTWRPATTSGA